MKAETLACDTGGWIHFLLNGNHIIMWWAFQTQAQTCIFDLWSISWNKLHVFDLVHGTLACLPEVLQAASCNLLDDRQKFLYWYFTGRIKSYYNAWSRWLRLALNNNSACSIKLMPWCGRYLQYNWRPSLSGIHYSLQENDQTKWTNSKFVGGEIVV